MTRSKSKGTDTRNKYDAHIKLDIDTYVFNLRFRVDTGSTVIIVRQGDLITFLNSKFKDRDRIEKLVTSLIQSNMIGLADNIKDANGNDVDITPVIVRNFSLTDDVVIDSLKIYVSNSITTSVLGMDILNLFRFNWDWSGGTTLSEIMFIDWEKRLDIIKKRCHTYHVKAPAGKQRGYIDTDQIMLLDSDTKSTEAVADKTVKSTSKIKNAGQYSILARVVQNGTTVSYKLMDWKGCTGYVPVADVIKMASKGLITNAVTYKHKNKLALRGKLISLKSLPVIHM